MRWYGHVERMEDDRLTMTVYESEMQRPICRGRPCNGWIDGVKEVLSKMGIAFQCDFMIRLHGKGRKLCHRRLACSMYQRMNVAVFFPFPFLQASPIGEGALIYIYI